MADHADIDHTGLTGVGGGDITTDDAWAAKGDLIVGTADDTAGILTAGTDGHVLTADSGETTGLKWAAAAGGGIDSGSSFPGSPTTGDLFYHTTHNILFYYDGTRWLCTCPHELVVMTKEAVVFAGLSTTLDPIARTSVPWKGTLGIWLVAWDVATIVVSTNDGSKYWTLRLGSTVTAGTNTDLGSGISTAADTHTTHAWHTEAIGAVLDANAVYMDINAIKVSTPGNLFTSGPSTIRFRYIGA